MILCYLAVVFLSSVERKPDASKLTHDLNSAETFILFYCNVLNVSAWISDPSIFGNSLKIVILFIKLHWQCLTLLHVISLVAY